VVLVSAQRLLRRVCPECRKAYKPEKDQMLKWGMTEQEAASGPTLHLAQGCDRCVGGYKGRTALLETLPMNDPLRQIIVQGGSAVEVKRKGLEQGMITLRRVGLLNALKGTTTVEEVLSITMPD
jgi:type IV pilus assembly protein PilB